LTAMRKTPAAARRNVAGARSRWADDYVTVGVSGMWESGRTGGRRSRPRWSPGAECFACYHCARLASLERSRQRLFRVGNQALFMPSQEYKSGYDTNHPQDEEAQADGPTDLLEQFSRVIGAEAIGGCPDDAAAGIEQKKSGPVHAICTSKQSCEGPQKGDEASEEDHFAAMPHEQVAAELEPRRAESHAGAIPLEQRQAQAPTDPKPDRVPDNRSRCCSDDDPNDVQLMRCPGQGCGCDKNRLAR